MSEKEGEQAHSPGRAQRNVNTFCDPGVWKYDQINKKTYGKENGRKRVGGCKSDHTPVLSGLFSFMEN